VAKKSLVNCATQSYRKLKRVAEMNKRRLFVITGVFILIMVVSLACNLGKRATPTPEPTISVSTEAVNSLQAEAEKAAEAMSSTGQATLTLSEEELTSLLTFELQKQENPPLREPQIRLRDGQVRISGKVQQGGSAVSVQLTLTLSADSNGRLQYEILSAKVGPLSLPDLLLEQLTAQLDQAFENNIYPRMEDMYIETITIQDGVMTIQGRKR